MSQDQRRRLEQRKAEINKLTGKITKQEAEHDEALRSHKDFLSSRNVKSSPSYARMFGPAQNSGSSTTLASSASSSAKPPDRRLSSTTATSTSTGSRRKRTSAALGGKRKTRVGKSTAGRGAAGAHHALHAKPKPTSSGFGFGGSSRFDPTPSSTAASASNFSKSDTDVSNKRRVSIHEPVKRERKQQTGRYKRRRKRSDDSSTSSSEELLHIQTALQLLKEQTHLFMQRLYKAKDIEAARADFKNQEADLAFQIFSLDGDILFLMEQQAIRWTSFVIYTKKSFESTLYDKEGIKVLKFIGPRLYMSRMLSPMKVTDPHGKLLGYVKTYGSKINYSVYNAKGERLFIVYSNAMIAAQHTKFTVNCRGEQCGYIAYSWKHILHDLPYIDYETTGLEFLSDINEKEKLLLLGAMILIEFTWYSPITKLRVSTICAVVFFVLLALIIVGLPFVMDPHSEDDKTKAFYTPNEIVQKPSVFNIPPQPPPPKNST